MALTQIKSTEPSIEIAILGRVLANGKQLSQSLARHLLTLEFSEDEQARINALADRNRHGNLAPREREELQAYANAGCLLGILHLKALRALKNAKKK